MANRRISARHVRKRRTYNVREAAKVLGTTSPTVRHWSRNGLDSVAGIRPAIFRGADIIAFLKRREAARKQPCGPGRLFCLRCKTPKVPAFCVVEFHADGPASGSLRGLCPDCTSIMHRRTSRARLVAATVNLKVEMKCGDSRLADTPGPHCNPCFIED